MYTKEALKAQLKQMGIKPTDTVVIHTSMKAIGDVEGGPDGVLDAFCEYLSDGLFLVPTHTWDDISLSYGIFEKPMVEMGVQTFGTFADAQVRIVDAMGCRQLIMKIYSRATEDIFLQYTQLPEALYKD